MGESYSLYVLLDHRRFFPFVLPMLIVWLVGSDGACHSHHPLGIKGLELPDTGRGSDVRLRPNGWTGPCPFLRVRVLL